ncbi:MAG: carboxypeptidase-like regulatory domain-containing protein, partial [Acidobacteria bacterium]|nr:carboxypeptidase-like regulatory domain-containing protein [Acidobacteriota bacterium]
MTSEFRRPSLGAGLSHAASGQKRIALAAILLCSCIAAGSPAAKHPPGRDIKGIVVGNNGPVAGAVVRIQATRYSTATDRNGRFVLSAPETGADQVYLTAWAPGHYCGGPLRARSGRSDARIRLN